MRPYESKHSRTDQVKFFKCCLQIGIEISTIENAIKTLIQIMFKFLDMSKICCIIQKIKSYHRIYGLIKRLLKYDLSNLQTTRKSLKMYWKVRIKLSIYGNNKSPQELQNLQTQVMLFIDQQKYLRK